MQDWEEIDDDERPESHWKGHSNWSQCGVARGGFDRHRSERCGDASRWLEFRTLGGVDLYGWRMDRVGLTVAPDTAAGRLSLFDQRRLEFAMRLVAKPTLLMLDEPVGGLNPEEIRSMIALISSLREHCGILIIEHTMKVITSLADRVMVLVNGRKLIDDAPGVVLRDRAVIETYLGA